MILGTPKFDGLAIGSLEVDFMGTTLQLKAVAGFVSSKTGYTHGWTKGEAQVWSQEIMQYLQVLKDSMERDLAKMHLGDGATGTNKTGLDLDTSGLAEHLGEAPSV